MQVEHVPRGGGVLGDREQRPRGRLELRDEVAREEARRGSRVGDRLLALVERLCGLERAARGEAEAAVRVALERGEVVEERRALGLLLALDRVDDAVLAGHALDDPVRAGSFLDPRLVAFEPKTFVGRLERGADEPVRLGDERLDLALALDDHRERRRLDAPERDDAAHPRAAADRRRARRIHAAASSGASCDPGRSRSKPSLIACFVIDEIQRRSTGLAAPADS